MYFTKEQVETFEEISAFLEDGQFGDLIDRHNEIAAEYMFNGKPIREPLPWLGFFDGCEDGFITWKYEISHYSCCEAEYSTGYMPISRLYETDWEPAYRATLYQELEAIVESDRQAKNNAAKQAEIEAEEQRKKELAQYHALKQKFGE